MHSCVINYYVVLETTSVCKGINSFIERYMHRRNSLVDFMHNFEHGLKEYKHNELMFDFKFSYGDHVLATSLQKIEQNASNFFYKE